MMIELLRVNLLLFSEDRIANCGRVIALELTPDWPSHHTAKPSIPDDWM